MWVKDITHKQLVNLSKSNSIKLFKTTPDTDHIYVREFSIIAIADNRRYWIYTSDDETDAQNHLNFLLHELNRAAH